LLPEDGFSGAEINTTALYLVIQSRLKETLTIIRDKVKSTHGLSFCGMEILLTGGGSRMRGVCDLTRTVFGRPCSVGKPLGYMGQADVVESPEFAAVLGMLRFAGMHPETRRRGDGWIDRVNGFFTQLINPRRKKGGCRG
jgi:cell division protein FtsA